MTTIRGREPADLPACVAALEQVHLADGYPTVWPADPVGFLNPRGMRGAWVAVDDGAVVAHAILCDSDGIADAAPLLAAAAGVPVERLAALSRLFVAPGARGLGLARILLDTIMAAAAGDGLRLALDVVAASPAVGLYERTGWLRVTTAPAPWTTPDDAHPNLHYYLSPAHRPPVPGLA